ncbi:MerR family DNA-binding transcriptional regulator [Streptomyces sp. NPDC001219]
MDDTGQLLTIGVFARRVGLAPSALRFYDDCGLLRPARVDAVTGYRRYGAGQTARAVTLRQLRAAGPVSLAVLGADRRDGPDAGGPAAPDPAGDRGDLAAGPVLEVTGGGRETVRMRMVHTGPGLRISFDPAVLVPALEAGVGPDVLLEITAPDRPVLVRSADQGSFTTLVMPVRETAAPDRAGAGRTGDRGRDRGPVTENG